MVFLALNSPSLVIRTSLYLLVRGWRPSHGRFISCFRGDRRGSECPSCTSCFLSDVSSRDHMPKCHISGWMALNPITSNQRRQLMAMAHPLHASLVHSHPGRHGCQPWREQGLSLPWWNLALLHMCVLCSHVLTEGHAQSPRFPDSAWCLWFPHLGQRETGPCQSGWGLVPGGVRALGGTWSFPELDSEDIPPPLPRQGEAGPLWRSIGPWVSKLAEPRPEAP